jgi:IclR family transcriptional regulator, KDG regulon repressor
VKILASDGDGAPGGWTPWAAAARTPGHGRADAETERAAAMASTRQALDTSISRKYCLSNETAFRMVEFPTVAEDYHPAIGSGTTTSVDKAFDVCEALSLEPGGMSLSDLSRALKLPRSSVHRLLAVLKRRGYVRQDEETQRYSLGVRTLDLSFLMLGRSELRMHAYPALKDYAAQSGCQSFLAVPASGEVTSLRRSEASDVAMSTSYGKEMPAHCALYFGSNGVPEPPRLSCLRLADVRDVTRGPELVRHMGFGEDEGQAGAANLQRLCCTCAPVFDYSGREVARIGVCGTGLDDRAIAGVHNRGAWELARHVSMRLGYLSAVAMGVR